ncbi:WW domain-binding protein 4-like, partial [Panonychus citri]|uniref:WW domain-binding protein 4-like n=1 Tax=Panonychus citri TaxID=50023 RepID=UPI002307CFB9
MKIIEFHERGLRHQNNVKKKLSELTKRNQVQKHETDKYNSQLMKIEAAALSAFSKDIAADPSKVQELATTKSMISTIKMPKDEASTSLAGNRFGGGGVSIYGDCMEENKILVSGREKALDTITSKMSKKYQWLESKTSEGKAYYWNRKTLETIWEPPSSGYLTIDEQQKMGINRDNVPLIGALGYKYDPYGQWENIENKSTETSPPN